MIKGFGSNKEFTPKKVGAALRKMNIISKHTNKGNAYFVVKLENGRLEQDCKPLANQEIVDAKEQKLPF